MEAPAGGVDDMTKLSYLHEPGVLQNLAARYELNEIYVSFQIPVTLLVIQISLYLSHMHLTFNRKTYI